MDVAFPAILKMDIDLMLYDYFGFYNVEAKYKMDVITRNIKKLKQY